MYMSPWTSMYIPDIPHRATGMLKCSYIEGTEEQNTASDWAIGGFQTGVQSLETFGPFRGMGFFSTHSLENKAGRNHASSANKCDKKKTNTRNIHRAFADGA